MTNFHDEPEVAQQRQNVVTIAQAMLNSQLGLVAGSRQLCNLRARVSPFDHDPDFLSFIGIDSETDHLPLGEVRQQWDTGTLVVKDIELRMMEERYREVGLSACRRLVKRFSGSYGHCT